MARPSKASLKAASLKAAPILGLIMLLLASPAEAAAGEAPPTPNAGLRAVLRESAEVVLQEGRLLLGAAKGADPGGAQMRASGRSLIEEAERMAAASRELSVEAEQAASCLRREGAVLAALVEGMFSSRPPLPEVARRVLAESERLRRSAREAPARPLEPPFQGLATGLCHI